MISDSNRNQLSGQGKGRRWRAKPLPPASSVSITAGPVKTVPHPSNPLGVDPLALLRHDCFGGEEGQYAAAYAGAPEQRYLADSSRFRVQLAVLEATRDFEAFSTLAASSNERIRRALAKRLGVLGIIDGGSVEDVLSLMAADEDDGVRSSVARATSDPELKRFLAVDPVHNVRAAVLHRTEDEELVALLAHDAHPSVRGAAARATGDRALLATYLDDGDSWVRSIAVERLRAG